MATDTKTLEAWKIDSVHIKRMDELDRMFINASKVLSDDDLTKLHDFVVADHKCAKCGDENRFRAARGSALCGDCFWEE